MQVRVLSAPPLMLTGWMYLNRGRVEHPHWIAGFATLDGSYFYTINQDELLDYSHGVGKLKYGCWPIARLAQ